MLCWTKFVHFTVMFYGFYRLAVKLSIFLGPDKFALSLVPAALLIPAAQQRIETEILIQ